MLKRIIIFTLLCFCVGGFAYASSLVSLTDVVTRHAPSTASDHTILFTNHDGVDAPTEYFTIEFPAGFDLSTLLFSDFALSHGATGTENLETTASASSATEWGVSVSGQVITLTHPTTATGSIIGGEKVLVKIGTNAGGVNQIVNTATLGSAIVRINTSAGEYGALAIPIANDQVGVLADVENDMYATIQWAVPEMRVGAPETNDDATFYIAMRTQSDVDNVILFTQPSLANLSNDGTYSTPIYLGSHTPGDYDLTIKTHQHLTKKLNDIAMVAGTNVLNFSTLNNAVAKGSEVLLAGDISNAGIDPATLGDDVVNSIDLSLALNVIDDDDPTGNVLRANLNQDIVVNSVDLSMMIKNLDMEGEY
ncbi:hypothetical protein IT409_02870 [Candidatus Falkowbacteria bacterium]|nr:hypothetical protein [Candidatus Falkowbacteria bacterium]